MNEQTKAILDERIASKRAGLIYCAHRLAERLTALAIKLEKYPTAFPNSLGELQASGTTFDAECAALNSLVEARDLIVLQGGR